MVKLTSASLQFSLKAWILALITSKLSFSISLLSWNSLPVTGRLPAERYSCATEFVEGVVKTAWTREPLRFASCNANLESEREYCIPSKTTNSLFMAWYLPDEKKILSHFTQLGRI